MKRNHILLIISLLCLSVLLLNNVRAHAQNTPAQPPEIAAVANGPPVLAAVGERSVDVGKQLQFSISTAGPDSDLLNYSATGLPVGAVFDPVTRTFSWTPGNDQMGTYTVGFHVTGGEFADTKISIIKVKKLSGKDWCAVYPYSTSISDLNPALGSSLRRFLNALGTTTYKGKEVPCYIMQETWRSKERNWLMYYSWKIAREKLDPASVPQNDKIYINWVHDDYNSSLNAAADMVKIFRMDVCPGMNSYHLSGNAADMFIFWTATENNPKIIYDNYGNKYTFTKSKSSSDPPDAKLKKIAESYGVKYPGYVIKGTEDVVHWEYLYQ